jgi:hypothetical protein
MNRISAIVNAKGTGRLRRVAPSVVVRDLDCRTQTEKIFCDTAAKA